MIAYEKKQPAGQMTGGLQHVYTKNDITLQSPF